MDGVTRQAHRALHGKILRHDDPAWEAIYPPNGFNCRCRVQALTDQQAAAAPDKDRIDKNQTQVERVDLPTGVDVRTGEVTHEVTRRPGARVTLTDRAGQVRYFQPDPGWAHRPGAWPPPAPLTAAERRAMAAAGAPENFLEGLRPPLAPKRRPRAATGQQADIALSSAFGITNDVPERKFKTVAGEVTVDRESVRHIINKFAEHREMFADYMLPTLLDPDEVRLIWHESGEWRLRFLKAWDDGKKGKGTLGIAAEVDGKYRLLTFTPKDLKALAKQREDTVLVWRRPPTGEEE